MLKFLRGTPLDFAGWTAHRRLERSLILAYEATVAELLEKLSAEKHALAVAIACIPEEIRGFDTVREEHLEKAQHHQAELLAEFRS